MAGSKNGKNKKIKNEKSNSKKSDSKLRVEQPQESSSSRNIAFTDEEQLFLQLIKKINHGYKEAYCMLQLLNYSDPEIRTAMLGGGCIIGEGKMASNIVRNSILYIESRCPLADDGNHVLDEIPIHQDPYQLSGFWLQILVSFAAENFPQGTTKCELLRVILSCKSIEVEGFPGSCSSPTISTYATELDALLRANIPVFENISLTKKLEGDKNAASSSHGSKLILNSKEQQLPSKASVERKDLNPLGSLPREFEQETTLQDWLTKRCDDEKDEMIQKLENLVKDLEIKVKEEKEWAEKKESEINEKERLQALELNTLRQETSRVDELIREKKELATVIVTKMMKTAIEIKKLEEKLKELEIEDSEIHNDNTVCREIIAENKRELKKTAKKEKEQLRKIFQTYDEEISKLQEQIHDQKEETHLLSQQLQGLEEAYNKLKLKLDQEIEENKKANNLYLEERRLLSAEKEKSRQALEAGWNLGSSSQDNENDHDDADIPPDRRCVVCLKKEVSVLFIPCNHLVVCFGCGERVGDCCPCCQVHIGQKIRVLGAGS